MNYQELKELQPRILERFERILGQKKLGHAYLFSGESASFDMAIFLSQARFCQEAQEGLPCGVCRNCRLIAQEEFSDVTIIRPRGNLIKTETVRELVKDFSQSGFESSKQVFIICDADKMHVNAANSLLKVIEEPQSDVTVFLLTSHEEAILPTIKSRTQLVHFPKNRELLIRQLEEDGLLKSQARILADLVASREEARDLMKSKAFQDQLVLGPKFLTALLEAPERAYLLVTQLASLTAEKSDQERLLDLLTLFLAEKKDNPQALVRLADLLEVRRMWKSNVSLQNALEYMILKEK